VRLQRAVAGVGVERQGGGGHGADHRLLRAYDWPFSDVV
jgi:hypothetical protein